MHAHFINRTDMIATLLACFIYFHIGLIPLPFLIFACCIIHDLCNIVVDV